MSCRALFSLVFHGLGSGQRIQRCLEQVETETKIPHYVEGRFNGHLIGDVFYTIKPLENCRVGSEFEGYLAKECAASLTRLTQRPHETFLVRERKFWFDVFGVREAKTD